MPRREQINNGIRSTSRGTHRQQARVTTPHRNNGTRNPRQMLGCAICLAVRPSQASAGQKPRAPIKTKPRPRSLTFALQYRTVHNIQGVNCVSRRRMICMYVSTQKGGLCQCGILTETTYTYYIESKHIPVRNAHEISRRRGGYEHDTRNTSSLSLSCSLSLGKRPPVHTMNPEQPREKKQTDFGAHDPVRTTPTGRNKKTSRTPCLSHARVKPSRVRTHGELEDSSAST